MFPGNRRPGNNGGFGFGDFPAFPAFPPFPSFPGFGRMGGRTLIEEFFGHDPFDDPFFRMGPGDMFGNGLFNTLEQNFLPARPRNEFFLEQRPFNPPPPQTGARRGPVIEELPDDEETLPVESRPNNKEPIVEHPDDDGLSGDTEHGQGSRSRQYEIPQAQANYTTRSFSYSSSTVSGPGGAYYATTSKRRINPDGLVEEELHEMDGPSGTESKRFALSVGDKMHAVSKKKNSDGRETTLETLHNLKEDEAANFDRTWGKNLGSTTSSLSNTQRLLEAGANESSGRSCPQHQSFRRTQE
eukprot:TRINITY_DN4529_c0_g1_i1.p1 TRINITY_DN4529_c0_g1~~TRINITY_DN4529_c0_g1_i1.p1  ORF type:complete len:299 (-),score=72.97 TRINITY_DN4529_c0_g1_i1:292-1188(-)